MYIELNDQMISKWIFFLCVRIVARAKKKIKQCQERQFIAIVIKFSVDISRTEVKV